MSSHLKIPVHPSTPVDYSSMKILSDDIKFMPQGFDNFKYLLVIMCEITNFVLAITIKSRVVQVLAETSIHRVKCMCSLPKLLIVDIEFNFIQFILRVINCIFIIRTHRKNLQLLKEKHSL